MLRTTEIEKTNVPSLIEKLYSDDGLIRQHARLILIEIGPDAVPALLQVMSSTDKHARWEAARALGAIKDPSAAPLLVDALEDEDINLRWAAMESLIALDRSAMRPLLVGLTKHFDSAWFCEGAHHVLHVLKDMGRLYQVEVDVLKALEGVAPSVEVPWAAKVALDALNENEQRKPTK